MKTYNRLLCRYQYLFFLRQKKIDENDQVEKIPIFNATSKEPVAMRKKETFTTEIVGSLTRYKNEKKNCKKEEEKINKHEINLSLKRREM